MNLINSNNLLQLSRNQLSHFSNDFIEFDQNYLQMFQLQAIRSKVFVFFIDRFALECEWLLNLYVYARVIDFVMKKKIIQRIIQIFKTPKEHSALYHLPILMPIIFDTELSAEFADDATEAADRRLNKEKLLDQLTKDCIISIKMSEVYFKF